MQRQSLGSPSKLQITGAKEEKIEEETKRRDEGDEEIKKAEKLVRSNHRTERSIHLIPIVTIFCLLVLYVFSYDPPQKELANFRGFDRLFKLKDSMEIGTFERVLDLDKSELLALRSHRSLQEVGKVVRKSRTSNLHRKFGDF